MVCGTGPRPLQQRQVPVQCAFPGVEYPPEMVAEPGGDVLHLEFGDQIQVDFRSGFAQHFGQDLGSFFRRVIGEVLGDVGVAEVLQGRQVPSRAMRESPGDRARLHVGVEPGRDHRFVTAADHHDLVDERVVGSAPAANLVGKCVFLGLVHRRYDQQLEIRPGWPVVAQHFGNHRGRSQRLVFALQR